MLDTIQNTFDILPFPMTAHELEEKLHTICDAVGCWDRQVCYDREFNRLYLARTEGC